MRRPQRRYDLDWIRVFVVLHLVPFHLPLALAMSADGGRISRAIIRFPGIFASPWHMHVMFLISGAATYYALRFRTIWGYALNRIKRLLVPLIFCLLMIVPVHHFYWRFPPLGPMVKENHYHNILTFFLKDYFKLLWMNGTFFLGNLWFVYYLFVFSLLCLPMFVYFESERGHRFAVNLADLLERPGMILTLGVPLAAGTAILTVMRGGMAWNIVDDLPRSFQYITCFIYGYLISSDDRLWRSIERHWKVSGVTLVILNVILMAFAPGRGPLKSGYGGGLEQMAITAIQGFNSWLWLILILGLGREALNFENRFLRYMREASYPFFIIHQPLILALGYYMRGWGAPLLIKASSIVILTTAGTILIYDLCVKRTNVTRFLFGLHPLPKGSR